MAWTRVVHTMVAAAVTMSLTACDGKIRSEFVAGCTSQGAPESKCDCLFDKLKAKYGVDGLEAMQKGQTMLPGFVEATAVGAAQCSGVDPAVALRQLGLASEPGESDDAQGDDSEPAGREVQVSDLDVIESTIAITASSEAGDEYADARKVAMGDLNGDGASDVAALFTIETSAQNTARQYLSAFVRQGDGSLRFATMTHVGGAGDAIDGVGVEEGAIRLKTLTLGPDDSACCPSIEGQIEYLLHNGKLKQIR